MHRSTDGLLVYDGNYTLEELGTGTVKAGDRFELAFDFVTNVTRGQYHFQLDLFHGPTTERVLHVNPVALLRVDEARTFAGVANLAAQATMHTKNDAPSNR
jgi:hypothetical protein